MDTDGLRVLDRDFLDELPDKFLLELGVALRTLLEALPYPPVSGSLFPCADLHPPDFRFPQVTFSRRGSNSAWVTPLKRVIIPESRDESDPQHHQGILCERGERNKGEKPPPRLPESVGAAGRRPIRSS